MSKRSEQRFSIQLDPVGADDWKWTVTCERCNQDLSADYSIPPITVLNLKGNISPMQMEQFRRSFHAALESGQRAILMNVRDAEFHEMRHANLQMNITDHLKTCGQPPQQNDEPKVEEPAPYTQWELCPSCTPPHVIERSEGMTRGAGCTDCDGKGVVLKKVDPHG